MTFTVPTFKYTDVTPFVGCPNCQRLFEYGAIRCPVCCEKIVEDYAHLSAAANLVNTQACNFANMIKGFNPFAVITVIGSLLIYAIDAYAFGTHTLFTLLLLWPAVPLITVLVWLFRFGWFKIGDDEYVQAKQQIQHSLGLWLAILVAQLTVLAM